MDRSRGAGRKVNKSTRPIVAEPGTTWTYCGGATVLLGRMIARGIGWGGQCVSALPTLDLVLAINCGNHDKSRTEQLRITSALLLRLAFAVGLLCVSFGFAETHRTIRSKQDSASPCSVIAPQAAA